MNILRKKTQNDSQHLQTIVNDISDERLRRTVCSHWNKNQGKPLVTDSQLYNECNQIVASYNTKFNS